MDIRAVLVAMCGCLLAFGAAMVLSDLGDQGLGPMVLAVVLSLALARQRRHVTSASRAVLVVAATALAGGVGWLLAGPAPVIGDIAFVVVMAGTIALRRFGPRWTGIGVVAMMPMIGLLVVPVVPRGVVGVPILLATAIVTVGCVLGVRTVAERTGFLAVDTPRPTPPVRPGTGLRASDRMALQTALGLAAAFVAGRLLFGSHWSWVVLTTFVVASGARGRGDVLHRGMLRMLGAGAGTVLASLLATAFPPATPGPIVAIFVVLAVATWLRPRSYAWWAAGVTAVVALLSDFLGQDAAAVLPIRLVAIAVGGVIAVAVAWFVLPVRTSAVVRRRVADALAALQDVLAAEPKGLDTARARFAHTLEQLEEIAPPLRTHRRIRPRAAHAADTVDALLACAAPVDAMPEVPPGAAARLVGELRRGLRDPAGHLSPRFAELPARLAPVP